MAITKDIGPLQTAPGAAIGPLRPLAAVTTTHTISGFACVAIASYKYMIGAYQHQSANFANRVTMLGGFDSTGTELTSTANDTTSQTDLGRVVEVIVVNRQITDQATLDLSAQIELDNRAIQDRLTFDFEQDGLDVGMLVNVQSSPAGISDNFVIQSLKMVQVSPTRTRYTAQVGNYQGDLANRLKELNALTNPTLVTTPVPGPDSVTNSMIDNVDASKITGSITASQIGSVNFSSVTGTVTVSASNITGSITSGQISSVSASSITGTLTSSQIGSVSASSITGSITSSQIGSVSASVISGGITSTQISSIDATTITINTISDSQIGSVNVSKLVAGTATFSGTVTLTHSGTGAGSVVLSSSGISMSGGGFTCTIDSGGLFFSDEIASGGAIAAGAGLSGSGLSITGNALVTGTLNLGSGLSPQMQINGTTVIDSSGQFVGAGVAVGSNGVGAGGFNPWNGSSYDSGVSGTITIPGGGSITVLGGVITAITSGSTGVGGASLLDADGVTTHAVVDGIVTS